MNSTEEEKLIDEAALAEPILEELLADLKAVAPMPPASFRRRHRHHRRIKRRHNPHQS